MLESFLFQITDHRRKQGRRYELGHILLFTILAILSGADSYRKVQKFIVAHYDTLFWRKQKGFLFKTTKNTRVGST